MEPYRVPFFFDRSRAPIYRLANVGPEPLRGVTITLSGAGVMSASSPVPLDAGDAIEVVIRGEDLARTGSIIVRWLRPSGDDYVWRAVF